MKKTVRQIRAQQNRMLTQEEAAARLGLTPRTLKNWRYLNRGPISVKVEGSVRYPEAALEAYLAAPERQPRGSAA